MTRSRLTLNPAILIGTVTVATVIYWALLISDIRLHAVVPGYFWHFLYGVDKSLDAFWLIIPLTLGSVVIVYIVLRVRSGYGKFLPLLILWGFCLQVGFGLIEGRGIDGIRDRAVKTGHAEFVAVAASNDDIGRVATGYETILREVDPERFRYVQTKPPGQLIVYMVAQNVSNIVFPVSAPEEKFDRLATFLSYVFPLLSYIVLIPLYVFGRSVADDWTALRACLLYLFIPAVMLVTLHLDQVIYPVLAMTCLMLATFACIRRWLPYSLLAGMAIYLSLFISFSLLPVIPLVLLMIPILCLMDDDHTRSMKRCGKIIAGVCLGILMLYAAGVWLLNYDPFIRFENAMRYHQQWKAWTLDTGQTIQFAFLNLIEFACWSGVAVSLVYLYQFTSAISGVVRGRASRLQVISLLFAGIVVLTALLGRTKGEVGRLWIFFIPMLCLFAGHDLSQRFERHANWAYGIIIGLQFITILVMKKYLDFW